MSFGTNGSAIPAVAGLMFMTGMGIPLMATLNSSLGQHLQSAAAATAVLFAVGAILAGAVLLVAGTPPAGGLTGVPWYLYLGAAPMIFYVISITWSAPRIGLGNAIFFVLLGQMAAAATIDHFGILGALRTTITARRAIGILVMAFGVYLARKPR